MKKFILLTCLFFTTLGISIAQDTIPNPGFEDWTQGGGYWTPDGWGTINHLIGSFTGGGTVLKTNAAGDVHSGTWAAKLLSKSIPGQGVAPGICVTGQVNPTTFGVDGGLAYNLKPLSLTGWFKYAPGVGDTASVEVFLSKWNGTSRDIVGHALKTFSDSVTTLSHFVASFDYPLPDDPDTAVIILLSSAGANGVAGSTLILDDLLFSFDNTGIDSHSAAVRVGVAPNPAQNTLNVINLNKEATLELFDVTGRKVGQFDVSENKHDVTINQYENGTYMYRISDKKENILSAGKLLIRH